MTERGVFAVDRGLFDHECFADEPFTEREAWVWLIGEAAWKPRIRRIGRVSVDLKRGQLAASLRFMAERWGWNKDRVDRFLTRLKNHDMIETAAATGITIITVCNYDVYQKVSLPSETAAATQTETQVRQQRDKTENIKHIEKAPSLRSGGQGTRLLPDWQPSESDLRFAANIRVDGAAEAAKFRDYWHARAGPGGKKMDWTATWRNWIRKAAEGRKPNGTASPNRFRAALDKLREHVGEDDGGEKVRQPPARLLSHG